MEKYFIYVLLQDGAVFYVGITRNIEVRLSAHKLKFGEAIILEVKEEYFGTKSTAYSLEEFWIKKYADLGLKLLNKHSETTSEIKTCHFCSKEIIQSQGKRPKHFCNETCRSNYWYGKNKKGKVREPQKSTIPPKANQDAPKQEKPVESPKNALLVKKTFDEWIAAAKKGVKDRTEFIDELSRSSLNGNQRFMVISKIVQI